MHNAKKYIFITIKAFMCFFLYSRSFKHKAVFIRTFHHLNLEMSHFDLQLYFSTHASSTRQNKQMKTWYQQWISTGAVVALMDRALDPMLWVWISALAGIVHDWGETLEQGTEPPTAPRAPHCQLPTAPSVCALGWVKCREHISLLVILCIIVYVTNKAHLSLIFNIYQACSHLLWFITPLH